MKGLHLIIIIVDVAAANRTPSEAVRASPEAGTDAITGLVEPAAYSATAVHA